MEARRGSTATVRPREINNRSCHMGGGNRFALICMFYTRIKTCLLLQGDLECDLLCCLGDGLHLGD